MRDGRYVVRSTSRERGGFVVYELVDMAGRVHNVALDHKLTDDEWADPILAHATRTRRHAVEVDA